MYTRAFLFPSLVFLGLLTTSVVAHADFLGARAGVVSWDQSWEGNIGTAILGNNVSVEDEQNKGFYLSFEQPLPFIPNMKVQATQMLGSGKVSSDFNYEGSGANTGDALEISLDSQDAILYGEILDNWVSLDLGLALRRYDAEFLIANGSIKDDASVVLPMVYGAARFDLPLSGFYGKLELLNTRYDGSGIEDYQFGLGYESKWRLGAELGIRQSRFELDDVDDFSTDLKVDGAYLALTLHI